MGYFTIYGATNATITAVVTPFLKVTYALIFGNTCISQHELIACLIRIVFCICCTVVM